MTTREKFEAWAALPPREWFVVRYPANSRWPGQYTHYHVQCAWDAWRCAESGMEDDKHTEGD